jgi:hypothetical protein
MKKFVEKEMINVRKNLAGYERRKNNNKNISFLKE